MEIIDAVGIRLPCKTCGQTYEVPLRDVLMSHCMIEHDGCPVSHDTECPPLAQQFLFQDSDLADLQNTWKRLQARAAMDGGELVLMAEPQCAPIRRQKTA